MIEWPIDHATIFKWLGVSPPAPKGGSSQNKVKGILVSDQDLQHQIQLGSIIDIYSEF